MPLYEYECESCGERFERIQKFSDSPIEICPKCGKRTVHKLVSSPAIQFKGSGFYINDYARKGAKESDAAKDGSSEGKEGKEAKEAKEGKEAKSDDKPADKSTEKPAAAASTPAPSTPTSTTEK
jgi:putative FmdB family regulatory protein